MSAVRVGLNNIHAAILVKDDVTGVEYETPFKLAKAIEASISPNANEETLFADDGPSEVATQMGAIEVELGLDAISDEIQAKLLGHKINSDGVLEKKAGDQAPYVALLFESATSDGKSKLYTLYKGKFKLPERNHTTKNDSPEFQTDTISATFLRRDFDDVWERSVYTGGETVNQAVVDAWFTEVYEPATNG